MPPVVLAAGLMGLSAVVQVLDAVIVRYLTESIHPFEILFLRNLFSLLLLAPLMPAGERAPAGSGLWRVHGARAVLKLAAMTSAFFAISSLPLSVFTAIAFTTPLFATLGAIVCLGEPVRLNRLLALVVGFIGVTVVLRPEAVPIGGGTVLALASAIGFAAIILLLKFTSNHESASRIVWLNLVISVPLGLLMTIPVWSLPSLPEFGLMALQGDRRARGATGRHQRHGPRRGLPAHGDRLHSASTGGRAGVSAVRGAGRARGTGRRGVHRVVARTSVFARGAIRAQRRINLTSQILIY